MQVVVEGESLPIAFSVAGLALFPVQPFVHIVFLVAGVALHRGVFEGRRQMTLFAFDLGMFAHEWKPGLLVVKRRVLP